MRLPYVQFHQAAYAMAPVLGSYLRVHRQRAMGMLLDLWRHGLEKVRDEDMPDGMIQSTNVVRTVAAICDWEGDPQLLSDSLIELGFLELRSPELARVRGMSRYVKVLEDAEARREHAKKAINARWSKRREAKRPITNTRVLPEYNSSSSQEVLNDTQHNSTQHKESKEEIVETVAPEVVESPFTQPPMVAGATHSLPGLGPLGIVRVGQSTPEDLVRLWDEEADPSLPRWNKIDPARRKQVQAALKQRPLRGECSWEVVFYAVNQSPFLLGANDRGWRANLDWVLKPGRAERILERTYDQAPKKVGYY